MSLFGALFSGVSGLQAQSSAMGAIADNVTNVNTTGYKGTSVNFNTLVTKQVSSTQYSPGGVQSAPRQNVDSQGLLSSTTSSTDIAISGQGLFVVNEAANPRGGDLFAYSRAGSFKSDDDGFLQNAGGFYLQAWSLQSFDGSENASLVNVGGETFMKAYKDNAGNTTLINDNIIDSTNLRPINLNEVGGTAVQTQNIRLGANLPQGDPVFDADNADAGGRVTSSVLIYDSLGSSHNLNLIWTKVGENAWDVKATPPSGSAALALTADLDSTDTSEDIYAAAGQLEFERIPEDGETVTIDDVVFEFDSNGSITSGREQVDISNANSVGDVVSQLKTVLDASAVKDTSRFEADGSRMAITQSVAGNAIVIDASNARSITQSQANISRTTGLPSGTFTVEEIDGDLKRTLRADFYYESLPNVTYTGETRTAFIINDGNAATEFRFFDEDTDPLDDAANSWSTAGSLAGEADITDIRFRDNDPNEDTITFTGNPLNLDLDNLVVGDRITIGGADDSTNNGTYTILAVADNTDEDGNTVAGELTLTVKEDVGADDDDAGGNLTLDYAGIGVTDDSDAATTEVVGVDLTGATTGNDVVTNLVAAIQNDSSLDGTSRFAASGRSLVVEQSTTGANVTLNWDALDDSFTAPGNVAFSQVSGGNDQITFTSAVAGDTDELAEFNVGDTFVVAGADSSLNNTTYTISAISVTAGGNYTFSVEESIQAADATNAGVSITWEQVDVFTSGVEQTGVEDTLVADGEGALDSAVQFTTDGLPKRFRVETMEMEWANGAAGMIQDTVNGETVDNRIDLFLGNTNTPDGLTQFDGDYSINFITQDGSQFGNFAGVTIGQDGIVTALFDNGETRPVAMIPIATFTNPNGMESLTGNSWIETDFSGQPTLREAGEAGAGSIQAASLESSTVDLGEEFTKMITTQRAYSSAAKIISTADEMLDELLRVKR